MEVLAAGQTTALGASNAILAVHGPVDLSVLVCDDTARVRSDDDMYFYNRPSGPGVEVRDQLVTLTLNALRPGAQRLVLIASPADQVTPFGSLPPITLEIDAGANTWTFTPSRLSLETALVLCEVYLHRDQWKVRVLGQGYASGLAGVAADYGITVEETPPLPNQPGTFASGPATTTAPPPAAPAPATVARAGEMATALAGLCGQAMEVYQQIFEKVDTWDRAQAMAKADYVDGIQQHPLSKQAFADMARKKEAEIEPLLHQLRGLSEQGRALRSDLYFLVGGPQRDNQTVVEWMMQHLPVDVQSSIFAQGIVIACDFGVTIESFLRENERMNEILSR
jgi:stress response protein SCP2